MIMTIKESAVLDLNPLNKSSSGVSMAGLFGSPIGLSQEKKIPSLKELDFFAGLKYRKNIGNLSSENSYLLEDKSLSNMKDWIQRSVDKFFDEIYKPTGSTGIKITQSWANLSKQGDYHHPHIHTNSLISGVYYVQTNSDDRITFSREGSRFLTIASREWNEWNCETWWYPAEEGTLILFPSCLTHQVLDVVGEKDRISLSFNTFPTGVLGSELDLSSVNV